MKLKIHIFLIFILVSIVSIDGRRLRDFKRRQGSSGSVTSGSGSSGSGSGSSGSGVTNGSSGSGVTSGSSGSGVTSGSSGSGSGGSSGVLTCPDGSQCTSSQTCCVTTSGSYSCCPYANAVCCSNEEDCCPNGFTCDVSAGLCIEQSPAPPAPGACGTQCSTDSDCTFASCPSCSFGYCSSLPSDDDSNTGGDDAITRKKPIAMKNFKPN